MEKFGQLREDIKISIAKTGGYIIVLGFLAGVILMIGGNFAWAAAQIALFTTGMKGLTLFTLPKFIANLASLAIILIGVWMGLGVVAKILSIFRDILVDVAVVGIKSWGALSLAIMEAGKAFNELVGRTDVAKQQTVAIDMFRSGINKTTTDLLMLKNIGKDLENTLTYPWRTLGEEGRWAWDLERWKESLFVQPTAIPTTTTGLTGTTTTGAENNMYGDVIINVSQPGTAQYGSTTDIERLIATLEATVAAMKQEA